MILFIVKGKQYDSDSLAGLRVNTLLYDPPSGEVWARIVREPSADWIAQPHGVSLLNRFETFPQSCPGSLIGPLWVDSLLWRELPLPLLQRELDCYEAAVQHLTRGESIWYNNGSHSNTAMEAGMQPSNEVIHRLAQARYKLSLGQLSKEELREALRDLRQHRMTAAEVSAKSKAAKAPVDTAAILSKFIS